jgi:hypothetical protein
VAWNDGREWFPGRAYPCAYCRAADNRDERHQRGCPKRKPISDEGLMALAVAVENGWLRKKKANGEKTNSR